MTFKVAAVRHVRFFENMRIVAVDVPSVYKFGIKILIDAEIIPPKRNSTAILTYCRFSTIAIVQNLMPISQSATTLNYNNLLKFNVAAVMNYCITIILTPSAKPLRLAEPACQILHQSDVKF